MQETKHDVKFTYGRKIVHPETGEAFEITDTAGYSGDITVTDKQFDALCDQVKQTVEKNVAQLQQRGWTLTSGSSERVRR
jgi:hypothetical protein